MDMVGNPLRHANVDTLIQIEIDIQRHKVCSLNRKLSKEQLLLVLRSSWFKNIWNVVASGAISYSLHRYLQNQTTHTDTKKIRQHDIHNQTTHTLNCFCSLGAK